MRTGHVDVVEAGIGIILFSVVNGVAVPISIVVQFSSSGLSLRLGLRGGRGLQLTLGRHRGGDSGGGGVSGAHRGGGSRHARQGRWHRWNDSCRRRGHCRGRRGSISRSVGCGELLLRAKNGIATGLREIETRRRRREFPLKVDQAVLQRNDIIAQEEVFVGKTFNFILDPLLVLDLSLKGFDKFLLPVTEGSL